MDGQIVRVFEVEVGGDVDLRLVRLDVEARVRIRAHKHDLGRRDAIDVGDGRLEGRHAVGILALHDVAPVVLHAGAARGERDRRDHVAGTRRNEVVQALADVVVGIAGAVLEQCVHDQLVGGAVDDVAGIGIELFEVIDRRRGRDVVGKVREADDALERRAADRSVAGRDRQRRRRGLVFEQVVVQRERGVRARVVDDDDLRAPVEQHVAGGDARVLDTADGAVPCAGRGPVGLRDRTAGRAGQHEHAHAERVRGAQQNGKLLLAVVRAVEVGGGEIDRVERLRGLPRVDQLGRRLARAMEYAQAQRTRRGDAVRGDDLLAAVAVEVDADRLEERRAGQRAGIEAGAINARERRRVRQHVLVEGVQAARRRHHLHEFVVDAERHAASERSRIAADPHRWVGDEVGQRSARGRGGARAAQCDASDERAREGARVADPEHDVFP